MDALLDATEEFINGEDFSRHDRATQDAAMALFDSIATFGSETAIAEVRKVLEKGLRRRSER